MKNCMSVQYFLSRLKVYHMVSFIKRFNLDVKYNNPQRRYDVMKRALKSYWKNNPLEECSVCLEPGNFDIAVATPCGHVFCDACLIPHIRRKETCPNCREQCTYLSILSQISIHRLAKLRMVCTEPIQRIDNEYTIQTETLETEYDDNSIQSPSTNSLQSQIHTSHLIVATILTIIVFLMNIFIIGIFIISIFYSINNFISGIEKPFYTF